jgi:hypothetical protein
VLGLFLLTLVLAGACKSRKQPDVRTAGASANTSTSDTTTAKAASGPTPPARIPEAIRAACGDMEAMLRDEAKAERDSSSVFTSPRDTTSTLLSWDSTPPEPACVLSWRDSIDGGNLNDLYARFEHSGWVMRPALFSADGPDGSSVAFSRTGVACIVRGTWDGPDDSDSTYVPKPGFAFEVTCLRDRPDRS